MTSSLNHSVFALTETDRLILNQVQKGFPVCEKPFDQLAKSLGMAPDFILERLQILQQKGVISRFGAVMNHHKAGASTLAALAVPEAAIEATAKLVNSFAGVNHNYLREHEFNLWFVVTAPDQAEVEHILAQIAAQTGFPLLDLPMLKGYHIDLAFNL